MFMFEVDWNLPLIGPSVLAGLGEMGNFQHAPTLHSCAPYKYVCGGNNAQAMSPVSCQCDAFAFALVRLCWRRVMMRLCAYTYLFSAFPAFREVGK